MIRLAVVLCLVFAATLVPAQGTTRLSFPVHGFSLNPIEGTSDTQNVQPVILMLPPSDGFAPNVNVQVQPFGGTLAEYVALSEGQFQAMKWKVKKRTKTRTSETWEYTGKTASGRMHWYSRAVLSDGRAFLTTATALESQWIDVGDRLKACVDSFQLDQGPPEGPPIADNGSQDQ